MKKFRFANVLVDHEICNNKEITRQEYKRMSDKEKETVGIISDDESTSYY